MNVVKYVLFDVDNTLYPRSSGLGRAMGDRIVVWVRKNCDVKIFENSTICTVEELCDAKQYNHPPDIEAVDELIERVCLTMYRRYGLTIEGLMQENNLTDEMMHDYLDFVHHPSKNLENYMPHKHEHVATKKLIANLKEKGIPMYLFSNAHDEHVKRIIEHLDVQMTDFHGVLEYLKLRHHCKPNNGAYSTMMDMIRETFTDAKPEECLFFDDSKANLKAAKEHGMITVYVSGDDKEHKDDYIDFWIDDVRNEDVVWGILEKCGIKKNQ